MAESSKLGLQSVAEWVTTVSRAESSTVEFTEESGLLQDTLGEICDRAVLPARFSSSARWRCQSQTPRS